MFIRLILVMLKLRVFNGCQKEPSPLTKLRVFNGCQREPSPLTQQELSMGTVLFDISFRFYGVISYYFHSIIDFTNPLSILFSKIFFNTISIIGPTNNPNIPQSIENIILKQK